jgi:hypothetical protein
MQKRCHRCVPLHAWTERVPIFSGILCTCGIVTQILQEVEAPFCIQCHKPAVSMGINSNVVAALLLLKSHHKLLLLTVVIAMAFPRAGMLVRA